MNKPVCVAIVVILMGSFVWARPVGIFSYEQAFKQADVVVIASAVQTVSTDDKWTESPNNPELIPDFSGQNTTFNVAQVLKGTPSGDQLKVLHFEYVGKRGIVNGPQLVAFRTGHITLKAGSGSATVKPEYMLFLKLRKDGRYEPAAGQMDPVLSVKEMFSPFTHHLGEATETPTK